MPIKRQATIKKCLEGLPGCCALCHFHRPKTDAYLSRSLAGGIRRFCIIAFSNRYKDIIREVIQAEAGEQVAQLAAQIRIGLFTYRLFKPPERLCIAHA